MFATWLVSVALAENEPVEVAVLGRAMAGGQSLDAWVDDKALAERASAGLEGYPARRAKRIVREGIPAAALARRVAQAEGHVVVVRATPEALTLRLLDRRGTVDWLLVELDAEGDAVDWTFLSDGVSASASIRDRVTGGAEAARRAEALDDLILTPLRDLPAELARLDLAWPSAVWPDLEVLERYHDAGDWDGFARTLDRIQLDVGADPWLLWLRGAAIDNQGHYWDGEALRARATRLDPSLDGQQFAPMGARQPLRAGR
jgi:hypothetical protein